VFRQQTALFTDSNSVRKAQYLQPIRLPSTEYIDINSTVVFVIHCSRTLKNSPQMAYKDYRELNSKTENSTALLRYRKLIVEINTLITVK